MRCRTPAFFPASRRAAPRPCERILISDSKCSGSKKFISICCRGVCVKRLSNFFGAWHKHLTRTVGEIDWQIEYVLNNARLLIVRFFNEERVVLNSFGQRLGRDRTSDWQPGT